MPEVVCDMSDVVPVGAMVSMAMLRRPTCVISSYRAGSASRMRSIIGLPSSLRLSYIGKAPLSRAIFTEAR